MRKDQKKVSIGKVLDKSIEKSRKEKMNIQELIKTIKKIKVNNKKLEYSKVCKKTATNDK